MPVGHKLFLKENVLLFARYFCFRKRSEKVNLVSLIGTGMVANMTTSLDLLTCVVFLQ